MYTIFVVFLSLFLVSCESLEKVAYTLFLEEDLLKRPEAKRCSDCHTKIYNQWKNSRHSVAWISEHFKKKTNNYSKIKCLSCHAPYEIDVLKEPALRDFHRSDGINCVSCHFKDKTNSMHGPYDVFSPPHYSTQDKNYSKSEICAGCHKETYKQWKKANVTQTCQSCHMPSRKDNLIQKFPFYLFHRKKDVHDHSFPVLKATEKDIKLDALLNYDEIKVIIKNTGIPHNLPTADQGKPKVYVEVEYYLRNRKVSTDKEMLTHKQGIPYNFSKEIIFYPMDKFDSIKITLYRKLSWKKVKEEITSLTIRVKN